MELRLPWMLKAIAVLSLVTLAAYMFGAWNRGEEWDTLRTKFFEMEFTTEAGVDESESKLGRSYSVNDGVKACSCENRTFYTLEAPEGVHSLCGEGATARGQNQKVVSFNFYGKIKSNRPYFKGIRRNAERLPKAYPGWTMRVYHALPKGHETLCQLSCDFPYLDLCNTSDIPGLGDVSKWQNNAWRFFPMGDPLVEMAMFRDLDSEFIDREVAVVDQWLQSDLTFHVMRDTPYHARTPVLAGMWGARVFQRRAQLSFLLPLVVNLPFKDRRNDQHKLAEHVWPVMKGDVMQHDGYGCVKYSPHGNVRPFPTRRNETDIFNWVGVREGLDKKPLLYKCPEECRPPEGKNWTYC